MKDYKNGDVVKILKVEQWQLEYDPSMSEGSFHEIADDNSYINTGIKNSNGRGCVYFYNHQLELTGLADSPLWKALK